MEGPAPSTLGSARARTPGGFCPEAELAPSKADVNFGLHFGGRPLFRDVACDVACEGGW